MFGFFDFNVTEIVEFPVVLSSLQLISNLLVGSVLYIRYAFSTLSEHLYAFVSTAISSRRFSVLSLSPLLVTGYAVSTLKPYFIASFRSSITIFFLLMVSMCVLKISMQRNIANV